MELALHEVKTDLPSGRPDDLSSITDSQEFNFLVPSLHGVLSRGGQHTPFTFVILDDTSVLIVPSGNPEAWVEMWGDRYQLIPKVTYRKHILSICEKSQLEYWLVQKDGLFAVKTRLQQRSGWTSWETLQEGLLPLTAFRFRRTLTEIELIGLDFCGWEPSQISEEEASRIRKECELFNAVKWESQQRRYYSSNLEFDDSDNRRLSSNSYEVSVWYDPTGTIQDVFTAYPSPRDAEKEILAARDQFPQSIWLDKWLSSIQGSGFMGESIKLNCFDEDKDEDIHDFIPF